MSHKTFSMTSFLPLPHTTLLSVEFAASYPLLFAGTYCSLNNYKFMLTNLRF
jgi:hypothetical protein